MQRLGTYWKEVMESLETDFQQDLEMEGFNILFCI